MTVRLDKASGRWRYDFQRNGMRYASTCRDPETGEAASSREEAQRIEDALKSGRPKKTPGNKADRSPPCRQGWVYFIITADRQYMKIGWAKSINSRLKALQTANAQKLEIFGRSRGTPNDERAIHALLRPHHARGEWFAVNAELLAKAEKLSGHQRALEGLRAKGLLGDEQDVGSPT